MQVLTQTLKGGDTVNAFSERNTSKQACSLNRSRDLLIFPDEPAEETVEVKLVPEPAHGLRRDSPHSTPGRPSQCPVESCCLFPIQELGTPVSILASWQRERTGWSA